jgi:hypothetical protein
MDRTGPPGPAGPEGPEAEAPLATVEEVPVDDSSDDVARPSRLPCWACLAVAGVVALAAGMAAADAVLGGRHGSAGLGRRRGRRRDRPPGGCR